MCGRFALKTTAQAIKEMFLLEQGYDYDPHFNIAPSQSIAVIRYSPKQSARVLSPMTWGFLPPWAKDPATAYKMINARAETVAEKPTYRGPFKYKRCLIPADGFYEWKQLEGLGAKQPYYIKRCDEKPFAFAGLWEYWCGADGSELETCTIITIKANELMAPIHNRMPVIIKESGYDVWLDPRVQEPKLLQAYLEPFPSEELEAYPVSTFVNKPENDTPDCLKPLSA